MDFLTRCYPNNLLIKQKIQLAFSQASLILAKCFTSHLSIRIEVLSFINIGKLMKYQLSFYLLSFSLLLSGCGGGGGSDSPSVKPTPPVIPDTTVTLQLSTTEKQIVAHKGDALPLVIEGTWSATNLGSNNVYVQLSDSSGDNINTAMSLSLEGENFSINTSLNHLLSIGEYESTISLVACKDSAWPHPAIGYGAHSDSRGESAP